MKVVIQKVIQARVEVDGELVSSINKGYLIFVGVHEKDEQKDTDYIIKKILSLKLFGDDKSFMNQNVVDVDGDILLVSQFTLYGDCKKGTRPSFSHAMAVDEAKKFYQSFVDQFKKSYSKVKNGIFGADMKIHLVNDGPVTIIIDS